MKIVCTVKHVPDPRSSIRALPDGSGIDPAGLKFVCDPFDEFGVELALQVREKRDPQGKVTAAAAGPPTSAEALRHALAMGCDRAVHAVAEATPAWDELRLAAVLAGLIRAAEPAFDLVVCGKQNIDNDAGEFGPALAEFLDLPHVGAVTKFELAPDLRSFRAHRRLEGLEEIVEADLPALVTVEKGLVEPRRPALARLMKAKSLPVESIPPTAVEPNAARLVALRPPAARPACAIIGGEPQEMARELVRRLRDEAKVL